MVDPLRDLQGSYDIVAEEYARRIGRELEDKPFDRALLDRYAVHLGEEPRHVDGGGESR